MKLRDYIEVHAIWIASGITQGNRLPPFPHLLFDTAEGSTEMAWLPDLGGPHTDAMLAVLRLKLTQVRAVRCLLCMECWMLTGKVASDFYKGGGHKGKRKSFERVPGRIEAMSYMGEDAMEAVGAYHEIKRDPLRLEPLTWMGADQMQGRMVGLLRPQGTMN